MSFDIDSVDTTGAPDSELQWNCKCCEEWWTEKQVANKETSIYKVDDDCKVIETHFCPNGCTDIHGDPAEVWWAWGNKITPHQVWLKDEVVILAQIAQDHFDEINEVLKKSFLDDYSID